MYMYVFRHLCLYLICSSSCVCLYVCKCAYACIYVYIYIHMNIYIYIYIYLHISVGCGAYYASIYSDLTPVRLGLNCAGHRSLRGGNQSLKIILPSKDGVG